MTNRRKHYDIKAQRGRTPSTSIAAYRRLWLIACWGCMLCTFVACHPKTEHGGRVPLAQVAHHYLYYDEVEKVVPHGLSSADSTQFIRDLVRKWAEDQVLYEKAEHNVRGDERIERLVANYRRSLILNQYEQQLILQKMDENITEEELQKYYEENIQLFVLEEPVIKGIFIKAPITSPGLKELKKWYKDNSDAALEELEKYAFRNAVIYDYFYDHWKPVSELENKVIVNLSELAKDMDKHRNIEAEDDEYCYLLHIEEYVTKGEPKPYDLARSEIIDLLANKHRVEFMQQVKRDLYNQSIEMGRIKYYDNEAIQTTDDAMRSAVDSTGYGSR